MDPRVPPQPTAASVGVALMLMSVASGCMDILCYGRLGHVLTSAMTGNTALLGLGLGQGDIVAASRNVAALAGFLAGLLLGAAMLRRQRGPAGWSRAITRVLVAEEALLVAFAVSWHLGAGSSSEALRYGLIALSAVGMGLQSAATQGFGVPGLATTYFTGTLTGIVVGAVGRAPASGGGHLLSRRMPWPLFAVGAYVAGAALAGFLSLHPGPVLAADPAAALPALLVAIVLLMDLAHRVAARAEARRAGARGG